MGTVMLNQSMNVCRLCGKEQLDSTISLFENSNDPSLKEEISFFLPIQVNIVVNGASYSCQNIISYLIFSLKLIHDNFSAFSK